MLQSRSTSCPIWDSNNLMTLTTIILTPLTGRLIPIWLMMVVRSLGKVPIKTRMRIASSS
ncbi:hypothetical protein C7212DRAFT_287229 [Tuber magnatum]|uniref:Uncharacterized protein n=1 Tax=Tuber magnatum TaxID=42249 RepID=A0A317SEG3_9PEZI|nr:hypothetical protein C7212DRAFT_287229 [Tuber magnatum]